MDKINYPTVLNLNWKGQCELMRVFFKIFKYASFTY